MLVSIIIPVFNEADSLADSLSPLQGLRGQVLEIIVVDGGSTDDTVTVATGLADWVVESPKGRALQMNTGARSASGKLLLFLHADTLLPTAFGEVLTAWQSTLPLPNWGFFHLRLAGDKAWFRVIERCINWRSAMSQVATGDQCLFVERNLFLPLGGFENIPIMEDVALCKRLRKMYKPAVLLEPVLTSSRRWEKFGVLRTVLLMWRMRLLYFLGVSPHVLAKSYQ